MEKDWTKIKSYDKLYLAEIAKQVLEDHNIKTVIINKQDSSYLNFGYIEIYVKTDNIIKAKFLLKDLN